MIKSAIKQAKKNNDMDTVVNQLEHLGDMMYDCLPSSNDKSLEETLQDRIDFIKQYTNKDNEPTGINFIEGHKYIREMGENVMRICSPSTIKIKNVLLKKSVGRCEFVSFLEEKVSLYNESEDKAKLDWLKSEHNLEYYKTDENGNNIYKAYQTKMYNSSNKVKDYLKISNKYSLLYKNGYVLAVKEYVTDKNDKFQIGARIKYQNRKDEEGYRTYIHELGHMIEHNTNATKIIVHFMKKVAKEKEIPFVPTYMYHYNEKHIKGLFKNPYQSRRYSDTDRTEVISVSLPDILLGVEKEDIRATKFVLGLILSLDALVD